jgi:transposase
VVEPTSILVNRRAKRAKTDRLDAEGMLRVLATYIAGDSQICSMVHVPTPDEEDGKRVHREREYLVQERTRIENRISALLVTQGIRSRPSLRSWERDMALLETGDGRKLPQHLESELNRLRRRLVLVRELISEMDAERDEHLTATSGDAITKKVTALSEIYGIGDNFAAVLTREVFYRHFGNRKQLASYVGLAPMPHQSGNVDRDRRIGRAGNARARKTLVEAAWLWLRYQPKSEIACWTDKCHPSQACWSARQNRGSCLLFGERKGRLHDRLKPHDRWRVRTLNRRLIDNPHRCPICGRVARRVFRSLYCREKPRRG